VPVRMSAPARAAALRSSSGTVGCSAADLAAYRSEWGVDFVALLARARGAGSFDKLLSGIPAETDPIVEGERIGELRDPWVASLHFGHAEGHVCLYWQEADLLISGDQLLPAISSNVSLYPGAASDDPLGDFLACASGRAMRLGRGGSISPGIVFPSISRPHPLPERGK